MLPDVILLVLLQPTGVCYTRLRQALAFARCCSVLPQRVPCAQIVLCISHCRRARLA